MNSDGFIVLTLVFARVAGLVLTAPIYGGNAVPLQVRALLAAGLTLLIAPTQWQTPIAPLDSAVTYLLLLSVEAGIGACLGFGVLILIHSMTLAGELIGRLSGLGIAEVFDPGLDENVPQFSRLLFLLAACVFLCIGGHRMVMAGLLDTFKALPAGSGVWPQSVSEAIIALVGQSFALGIRAAAPAMAALLLTTLTLGLIGRTLPQLNILTMGFGVNAMLAFAALAMSLGAACWAFQNQIEPTLETILDALKTPLQTRWMS
ncbi:MAG: flagellar biosynthetic protein FliR [Planctomycetaceae bacterium]|nr:flagellar biosynthetic protein FliR [Planctomycetaceae bacterium]